MTHGRSMQNVDTDWNVDQTHLLLFTGIARIFDWEITFTPLIFCKTETFTLWTVCMICVHIVLYALLSQATAIPCVIRHSYGKLIVIQWHRKSVYLFGNSTFVWRF